jgi:hypothetical protein
MTRVKQVGRLQSPRPSDASSLVVMLLEIRMKLEDGYIAGRWQVGVLVLALDVDNVMGMYESE